MRTSRPQAGDRASTISALNGVPYHIVFRNRGALKRGVNCTICLAREVVPILVCADKLKDNAPQPMAYALTAGCVRT